MGLRLAMLWSVLCAGCEASPTEILIVVETDLAVPSAIDEVVIEMTHPEGVVTQRAVASLRDAPPPRSLGMVHEGGPLGPFRVSVQGRHDGATQLERVGELTFVESQIVVWRISLTRDCLGVDCAERTCAQGACRSVVVGASELDGYPSSPIDASDSTDAGAPDGGGSDAGGSDAGSGLADAGGVVWRFEEVDGQVAFEAEHFARNEDRGTARAWYETAVGAVPEVPPDPDPSHAPGASGGAYLEGLPDGRVTTDDALVEGVNHFSSPGAGPTLTYRVVFNTVGRFYVHARAYSTGDEDETVHVGIDGDWPASGEAMQWCMDRRWEWSSAQRAGAGCGGGRIWLDVDAPGEHEIQFSMREDGFELDKIVLSTEETYEPMGLGPAERLAP